MSKYFTQAELVRSATAHAKKIDNTPPASVIPKLAALATSLLDPIREKWGAPIIVNSGYRSPLLNKAVGGSTTSQHLKGEAADITAGSPAKNKLLFEMIKGMIGAGQITVGQLIWEKGDSRGPAWVHISTGTKNEIKHIK